MSTVARYSGHCSECHEQIDVGQRIKETDDGWAHEGCIPARVAKDPPLCADCFIMHPEGACDA